MSFIRSHDNFHPSSGKFHQCRETFPHPNKNAGKRKKLEEYFSSSSLALIQICSPTKKMTSPFSISILRLNALCVSTLPSSWCREKEENFIFAWEEKNNVSDDKRCCRLIAKRHSHHCPKTLFPFLVPADGAMEGARLKFTSLTFLVEIPLFPGKDEKSLQDGTRTNARSSGKQTEGIMQWERR